MSRQVYLRDITDEAKLRPIHLVVLSICFLTSVVDGLDNLAIGYTAPAIAADLHISTADLGGVFSAGTFGTLIGSVTLGRLADGIGRRGALMICTLLFAVLTAVTPLAGTVMELVILRFAAGLGLGGAMPCLITLVSEYAPKRRKAFAAGLLWCGYPTGGVIGGLLGSQILKHDGWHAIFYVGGGLALLVVALQWLFLPESIQFLASRGDKTNRIRRLVHRLDPAFDFEGVELKSNAAPGAKAKLGAVFAEGRAVPTVLLWLPLFLTFMMTTFMVLWMPSLLKMSGMPIETTALIQALGNLASLPSMAAAGFFLDKVGPLRVLPFTYGALALAFALLAVSLNFVPVVAISVVLIGFLQGPGIAGMIFLSAWIYPSEIRSTGVGLAMGIGRSGQVVGSLVIGWIVAQGVSASGTVLAMCLAPVGALVSVLLLGWALRHGRAETSAGR